MKEIEEKDFEREVLQCNLPVVTCFTTEWCGSCYPTCLIADELSKRYAGKVKFVRINADRSSEVSARYHIMVMPTIIAFRDSQPMEKRIGFQDRNSWKRLLFNIAVI